jgi:DNA-binding XRE family transcriptional regulator
VSCTPEDKKRNFAEAILAEREARRRKKTVGDETMNKCAAYGAGRNRHPWRIREFLDERGVTQANIAHKLGISRSIVNRTIRGMVNNRAVLGYLHAIGCPEEYLSLPNDMKIKEKVA